MNRTWILRGAEAWIIIGKLSQHFEYCTKSQSSKQKCSIRAITKAPSKSVHLI